MLKKQRGGVLLLAHVRAPRPAHLFQVDDEGVLKAAVVHHLAHDVPPVLFDLGQRQRQALASWGALGKAQHATRLALDCWHSMLPQPPSALSVLVPLTRAPSALLLPLPARHPCRPGGTHKASARQQLNGDVLSVGVARVACPDYQAIGAAAQDAQLQRWTRPGGVV